MAKKILIIYSTAGAGHKKAALAVKKAFDLIHPDAQIDIIDALDYTSAFFKWTYPRIYIFLVNRIPLFWGICYYLLDNRFFYSMVSWMRHLTNRFHARALAKFLRETKYEVIISTHFLPPDIISMVGKDKIPSRLINVVTDYRMHTFWYASATDFYVVAHELTKEELMEKYRVPEEKIKVFGIPIDPVFSEEVDRDSIKAKLGIEKGRFTVLIGSGGFGVGPVLELVESFKGISIPVELLVVCGKNEPLCISVGSLQKELGFPVKAYGFVDNMDELMAASDIIITKTGALMSSEALAKGLPIIGIAPIPGQETRNYKVLSKIGVALEGNNIKEIPETVKRLFEDEKLIADIKKKIETAKRPDAAFAIARFSMEV